MGAIDELKNKGEELKGKAQQAAGGALGDRELQAEGLKQEKTGELKQAGEKLKDALS